MCLKPASAFRSLWNGGDRRAVCSNVCWLPFRPVSTPRCVTFNAKTKQPLSSVSHHQRPHHLALDGEARLSSASPLCYLIVGLVTQCVAMANAACSVAACSALPCTMLCTACFLAPRFASFLAPLLFLDNHHEPFALSPFVICSDGFRSRFHLLRSCTRGRWSMQG